MKLSKLFFSCVLLLVSLGGCSHADVSENGESTKVIKIILGSTRDGRLSEELGSAFKAIADKAIVDGRPNLRVEIIDLQDYNLPFFSDETPPAARTIIKDPVTQDGRMRLKKLMHLSFLCLNIILAIQVS